MKYIGLLLCLGCIFLCACNKEAPPYQAPPPSPSSETEQEEDNHVEEWSHGETFNVDVTPKEK